jgi:hypothetical protein
VRRRRRTGPPPPRPPNRTRRRRRRHRPRRSETRPSRAREFLGQHGGVVGDAVGVGERALDLRDADLAIGIGQKVHAMPRAQEQALSWVSMAASRSTVPVVPNQARFSPQVHARKTRNPRPPSGHRRCCPPRPAWLNVLLVSIQFECPSAAWDRSTLWASTCLADPSSVPGARPSLRSIPSRRRLCQRIEAGLVDEFEQVLLAYGQGHGLSHFWRPQD